MRAGLPAMGAALQAADTVQGLASHGPPLAYSQDRHLLIHRVSPALLQGTPPA
ncbi:hypothetical protein HMPREF1978_00768 [Actinomyces graevenitzii F0530]|uniref:Uncharacterized protein n=1 Tax=Actinomyces graevenitzii F0530 TaxID=1321817 RepID=U1Q4R4_9ACTO|nr:hypothetical protein HMPREF1978_00768 [Actinomyces graevenitzii F0530]